MFRAALLTGTLLRASSIYALYACGMSALGLSSVYLGKQLASTILAETLPAVDDVEIRHASRVERRLKQMAKAAVRSERPVRPGILAYTVPDMNAAQLAVALDMTEHPPHKVILAAVAPDETVETADIGPNLSSREATEGGARVAGYVAVVDAEAAAVSDAADSESDVVEPSEAVTIGREDASAVATKAVAARARRVKRRSAELRVRYDNDNDLPVRFAETPGEMIQRKLGGTT